MPGEPSMRPPVKDTRPVLLLEEQNENTRCAHEHAHAHMHAHTCTRTGTCRIPGARESTVCNCRAWPSLEAAEFSRARPPHPIPSSLCGAFSLGQLVCAFSSQGRHAVRWERRPVLPDLRRRLPHSLFGILFVLLRPRTAVSNFEYGVSEMSFKFASSHREIEARDS